MLFRSDTHVALVGPGGHAAVAAQVAVEAASDALRGRVHVVPPWSDERPLEIYGDADVLVLASTGRNENFGLVAAEAVAAGTPVVVSDQTGIAELVAGRAGIVVPPTAGAVREALGRILGDEEVRDRLRSATAALAEEHSAGTLVERQESLYRSVLER